MILTEYLPGTYMGCDCDEVRPEAGVPELVL